MNYRTDNAKKIMKEGGTWQDVADFYRLTANELRKLATKVGEDPNRRRTLDRKSVANGGTTLDNLGKKQKIKKTKQLNKSNLELADAKK